MTAAVPVIISCSSSLEEHSLLSSEDDLPFRTPNSSNSQIYYNHINNNPIIEHSPDFQQHSEFSVTPVFTKAEEFSSTHQQSSDRNNIPPSLNTYTNTTKTIDRNKDFTTLLTRNTSSNSLASSASMLQSDLTYRLHSGVSVASGLEGLQNLNPQHTQQQLPKRSLAGFTGNGIGQQAHLFSHPLSPLLNSYSPSNNNMGDSGNGSQGHNNPAGNGGGYYVQQQQFISNNSDPNFSPQHTIQNPSQLHQQMIGSRLALNMHSSATAITMTPVPSTQIQTTTVVPGPGSVGGESTAGGQGTAGSSPSSRKKGNARIKTRGGFEPRHLEPLHKHRGELSIHQKYSYDLSRAQLKASSRTSALLAGFAMIALVELQYQSTTPKPLLIMLGVVTTLLVSVHLLALMMSTCLLPYIEANGCTQDSPHIKLKFYIKLSWLFSTCIGLVLFLVEIGVIFFVKFDAIGYQFAAYITTGILVPVLVIFTLISYLIHRNRFTHSIDRVNDKVVDLEKFLSVAQEPPHTNSTHRNMVGAGLQGVTVVRNLKEI